MRRPILALIQLYQVAISPGRPLACKYQPTCSHYGHEAVARYGVLSGGIRTAWRLLRCNPFSKGGYDPVE